MDPVKRQYEAYPYPARRPEDERKRLIKGAPSHPAEIDHMLFGGKRDWSRPFNALVAGGGTGDGLIMLAQVLSDHGCPAEITYIDMSKASREIAEARAKVRGLKITFLTGDLLTAPDLGRFDYIDCTGVLHHLPEPQAGFDALSEALALGGGIGGMVYAPYGRTGVYPLQGALRALTAGEAPEAQVAMAKQVMKSLPKTNWFPQNRFVNDHRDNDAGLYDLLLHSRDRPYDVEQLNQTLTAAGLALSGFHEPARYDPRRYLPEALWDRLNGMDASAQAALAERLAGNMKVHIFYASRSDAAPTQPSPDARPRLNDLPAGALGQQIAKRGQLKIETGGEKVTAAIDKSCGPLVARADGSQTLGRMAQAAGLDWLAFSARWKPAHDVLTGWSLLRYSEGIW